MLCRSASTKSKVRALLSFFSPARPARHSPQQKLTHNARSLLSRAALTLALEHKNEDTARLRANHETMREQLQVLRKAAIAKLGLPAEEPAPSEEPAAAAATQEPAAAVVASDDAPLDLSDDRFLTPRNRASAADEARLPVNEPEPAAVPLPLPKPLAEVLREPLRALDDAATKARASVPLRALDEAASKARATFEREREGLARGLSDALSRLRSDR